MARENNFLLGKGERLTGPVDVPKGGDAKKAPYGFDEARKHFAHRVIEADRAFEAIPDEACPDDRVVAVLTMHPRYVSKSDFPVGLLRRANLRAIGSKPTRLSPRNWGTKKHPDEAATTALFVEGTREDFHSLADGVGDWTEDGIAAQLQTVEDVTPYLAEQKLRTIPQSNDAVWLELVLHNAGMNDIVQRFSAYARKFGARIDESRVRTLGGLTFLPAFASPAVVHALAQFSLLRVARGMPTLRPFRPGLLRRKTEFEVELPDSPPLDNNTIVAVLDGGIPDGMKLSQWVDVFDAPGVGPASSECQEHGLAVTSAVLFGPLQHGEIVPQPVCRVHHYRVLDTNMGRSLQYLDVLDRIVNVLDTHHDKFSLVNLSLGPDLPVEDDEVTAWTAALDDRLHKYALTATVAAGNDGDRDAAAGLNRVQPPADGVNVLAVGATNTEGPDWRRASYSCVGPGRSPGLVKPDGVCFGGSEEEFFNVLRSTNPAIADGEIGTSFAAPYAMRGMAGVRAQLGVDLNALALRALMIHRAAGGEQSRSEAGWGRFVTDPALLITTPDDEALVVYQGELPVSQHLRAPVPVPDDPLEGFVTIGATLVIAPATDPEHPFSYTKSGLGVAFRPHSGKRRQREDGTESLHAKTRPFFSPTNMYNAGELELRDGGHKWEPCLRHEQRFRAKSLHEPCLDIYYHRREGGAAPDAGDPLPYALVVSVRAPKVPDLYNKIVRAYAKILQPIRPKVRVPIRT